MPSVDQYLKGYGLHFGLTINNYKIINLICTHLQVKLWNEYSYPTEIAFQWKGTKSPTKKDISTLLQDFTDLITGFKIIRSDSNRPYKCIFMWPIGSQGTAEYNLEGEEQFMEIVLKYTGHAKRIAESEVFEILRGGAGKEWN